MNRRILFLASMTLAPVAAGLAACNGDVLWSGPGDAGLDAAVQPEAGPIDSDAGTHEGHDAGEPVDASSPADGSLGCSPALSRMLAAAIVPLGSMANLDLNHGGPATVSLAYAQSVNCDATLLDAGADPGTIPAAWGVGAPVSFEYDEAAPNLFYLLTLGPGYTGSLTFHSRAGGAYGSHTYEMTLGSAITRDGVPFAIDWTGSSSTVVPAATIASVNELSDALLYTFAPTYPVETDCYDSDDCIIVPDDLTSESGGPPSSAVIGFRPLKFYAQMPVASSTPNLFYTLLTGGPDQAQGAPPDAGVLPGMDAGGGVVIPTGCANESESLWGSCAHPITPLCDSETTWHPVSCRDYPQSGYVATCCPPADGG